MSAKKVCFAALLGACWSWSVVGAQAPTGPDVMPAPMPTPVTQPQPQPAGPYVDTGGTGLSSWITYDRNNCCKSAGGSNPIMTEVIFRVGPSMPVGGEYFGRNLNTGWMIEIAARAMFFNPSYTAAWNVELGVSNTYNDSTTTNTTILKHDVPANANLGIPANVPTPVSVRALDRTFANLGAGREWYLWGVANNPSDTNLRFGADFGGRYGAATVKFNELRHHTQVIEGIFAAVHTDLEIPWGRCTYLAGIRAEYGFTWSNIFDTGRGDLQDLTALVNVGVRY